MIVPRLHALMLIHPILVFLGIASRKGKRVCFFDPDSGCGQSSLGMQCFPSDSHSTAVSSIPVFDTSNAQGFLGRISAERVCKPCTNSHICQMVIFRTVSPRTVPLRLLYPSTCRCPRICKSLIALSSCKKTCSGVLL